MKPITLILSILFLTSCATHSMAPVIEDLEDDKAVIQFIWNFGDEKPSKEILNAETEKC